MNWSALNHELVLYLHAHMFKVQCRKNIRVEIRQKKEWVKLGYIKNMPMSCVIRLNKHQNESINSILQHGWKSLFCGMHCFMISICYAESHFNDSTNERYHLLIHQKKL